MSCSSSVFLIPGTSNHSTNVYRVKGKHSRTEGICRNVLPGNTPTGKSCWEILKVARMTALVERKITARKGRQKFNILIHNQLKECFKDMANTGF